MMDILAVDFQLRKLTKVTHTKDDHVLHTKKYENKIRNFIDNIEATMTAKEVILVMEAIISPIHHRRVKNPIILQVVDDYFCIT